MSGLERLIRVHVERGETDEAIAKALDVSASTVRFWRLRWGFSASGKRDKSGGRFVRTPERTERANDLRMQGWRPERIARELGVSRRTVYRMLRPELKDGSIRVYSAATRQRMQMHMRRYQPLGVKASRRMVWRGLPELQS